MVYTKQISVGRVKELMVSWSVDHALSDMKQNSWLLTLSSLNLPLSSSSTTSRELLVVDEDDLLWFKN